MQEIFSEMLVTYLAIYSRYLVIAFIVFILYYFLFKKRVVHKKIQLKYPKNKDYYREISYSTIAVFFMAATSVPFFTGPLSSFSKIFYDINAMPWYYHVFSFLLMMIMHDTYFYWMHRALHHPRIFKIAHLVHHKSTNPSPWAAYSFHPVEAFFESLIGPIILLLLPVHIGVFIGFFIFQIIYNVYGHSGFEFWPKDFHKNTIGRWINTSIHHNLHHKYNDNSYGLYFTFWDRIMGTMHPKYDDTYAEVSARRAQPKVSSVEI